MDLREYLHAQGYKTVDEEYYDQIGEWEQWYKGEVQGFHDYRIYNGDRFIHQKRARLNMAKMGAEYWANLLWNQDCYVTVRDPAAQKLLDDTLALNSFTQRTYTLVEKSFALGTGAYLVYDAPDGIRIGTVTARHIFPLAWEGETCHSCAFAGLLQGANTLLYLMVHLRQTDGSYRILNRYFQVDAHGQLAPAPLPEGVLPEYHSRTRRFALLRPNIVNNQLDSPLGMSIYGNCLDVLKSIDLAYDGVKVSLQLGRPRVAVSGETLKLGPSGHADVFDPQDIAFYRFPMAHTADEQTLIKDITTEYRADKFEISLQRALTLFSQQIGLGDRAFQWDSQRHVLRTATQVIAENASMLRSMEKHQEVLRTAVETIARAVFDMRGIADPGDLVVRFDDSTTRDRNAERERAFQWVEGGYFPFWRYLMDYEGYDQTEAMAIAQK